MLHEQQQQRDKEKIQRFEGRLTGLDEQLRVLQNKYAEVRSAGLQKTHRNVDVTSGAGGSSLSLADVRRAGGDSASAARQRARPRFLRGIGHHLGGLHGVSRGWQRRQAYERKQYQDNESHSAFYLAGALSSSSCGPTAHSGQMEKPGGLSGLEIASGQ